MKLPTAKTETLKQKFMNKTNAMIYFGFTEKNERTFERYLEEFKDHKDFKDGYINPTGYFPLIDINKFESWLRWKDKNKNK